MGCCQSTRRTRDGSPETSKPGAPTYQGYITPDVSVSRASRSRHSVHTSAEHDMSERSQRAIYALSCLPARSPYTEVGTLLCFPLCLPPLACGGGLTRSLRYPSDDQACGLMWRRGGGRWCNRTKRSSLCVSPAVERPATEGSSPASGSSHCTTPPTNMRTALSSAERMRSPLPVPFPVHCCSTRWRAPYFAASRPYRPRSHTCIRRSIRRSIRRGGRLWTSLQVRLTTHSERPVDPSHFAAHHC
jgi:hypothetical protein